MTDDRRDPLAQCDPGVDQAKTDRRRDGEQVFELFELALLGAYALSDDFFPASHDASPGW